MKIKNLALLLFIFSDSLHATTWKKVATSSGSAGGTAGTALLAGQCPTNYILVPKLAPYTIVDFCVMKYEAKNDGYGTVESLATSVPWTNMDRPTSRSKCQAQGAGYDMISNDQWQTISRNIVSVASNWSTGVVSSGELNRGHTDNAPGSALAASVDDVSGNCTGTAETCSSTVWDSQRRTHTLSNGNVIWDMGGNVQEWVTNNNDVSNGADGYISTMSAGDIRQARYGALAGTFCASPSATPWCGMGYGTFAFNGGAVIRGGGWSDNLQGGLFRTYLFYGPTVVSTIIGFRCVFIP